MGFKKENKGRPASGVGLGSREEEERGFCDSSSEPSIPHVSETQHKT